MKKCLSIILLIVEAVGIFFVCSNIAKKKANHYHAEVIIPEGMLLTVNDEISIPELSLDNSSGEVSYFTIPAGCKVKPVWIGPSSVTFVCDKLDERHNLKADCFEEQEQLMLLNEEAETKTLRNRKEIITKWTVIGIAASAGWIIIGFLLMMTLLKKKKYILLFTIHIVLILLLGMILSNFMYLEHKI